MPAALARGKTWPLHTCARNPRRRARSESRAPSGYGNAFARALAVEEQIRSQVLPHPGLLGLIFRRIPPARVSGQADQDASTGLCHEVRSRGADPIPADVLAQPSAEEIQPEQPGQIPAEVSADGLDAGREAHDLRPVLGSGARVAPRRCQLFAELSEELSRPFAARGPACRGAPELHADPVPKRPLLTQTTQHRLVDRYY